MNKTSNEIQKSDKKKKTKNSKISKETKRNKTTKESNANKVSKEKETDKNNSCYCPNCGTKNNRKNKRCVSCDEKLRKVDENFFSFVFDNLKGDLIEHFSSSIVSFIKAHLYGIVMSVSLVSMIATNVLLNQYNREHLTDQDPFAYYNAYKEPEKDERDSSKEMTDQPVDKPFEEPISPSPEPSTEPTVEPEPAPVEVSCTPKRFANSYTYVYDNRDTCTNEGYSAFDYVSYNVNSNVFSFGCDEIVDDCGTTWYGVYYLVHNSETEQNERFYY